MNYDPNKDYYSILGLSDDATIQQIEDAYLDFVVNGEQTPGFVPDDIAEAYDVLTHNRTEYDNAKAHYLHVQSVAEDISRNLGGENDDSHSEDHEEQEDEFAFEDDEQEEENNHRRPRRRGRRVTNEENAPARTTGRGRRIVATTTASLLVLALLLGAGHHIGKAIKNADIVPKDTEASIETTVDTSTDVDDNTIDIADNTQIEGIPVVDFGDVTNEEELNTRAQSLLDYVNGIGAINMSTGSSYTLNDMKELILYINGAYLPKNEAAAINMEDNLLNFVCTPLNDPCLINSVNFMAGAEVLDGSVVGKEVSFVNTMLAGNSTCYPYLQWLEATYNKVITSDNVDVKVNSYNEAMQSFADIIFGDGFTMVDSTGKEMTITSNDLANKTYIVDGNLFRMYGLLFPVFRSSNTQETFTVYSSTSGNNTVSADTILEQLNVRCAADIAKDVEYNTDGYMVLPESDTLNNLYGRIQINSISAALTNEYFGNIDYYTNTQGITK